MHKARSVDREDLLVITVYEPGVDREHVKRINPYSKRHFVLINRKNGLDWK